MSCHTSSFSASRGILAVFFFFLCYESRFSRALFCSFRHFLPRPLKSKHRREPIRRGRRDTRYELIKTHLKPIHFFLNLAHTHKNFMSHLINFENRVLLSDPSLHDFLNLPSCSLYSTHAPPPPLPHLGEPMFRAFLRSPAENTRLFLLQERKATQRR